jgi:hypothetical protein
MADVSIATFSQVVFCGDLKVQSHWLKSILTPDSGYDEVWIVASYETESEENLAAVAGLRLPH